MSNIIRTNRKSISLSIDREGQLIIKAPLRTKDEIIAKFCQEKENWIARQRARQAKIRDFKDTFDFDNYVYILGEQTNPAQFDLSFASASKTAADFEGIYSQMAEQLLVPMAKNLAKQLNLELSSVKLTRSHRFWGSLDRHKNMKLNYQLIVLPKELVQYVIIHELCHGVELNHSPKFWAEVKKYCPQYKKRKRELELYSFLLDEK